MPNPAYDLIEVLKLDGGGWEVRWVEYCVRAIGW